MRSGFILEGERETHLHRVAFRTLTEAALSPADSKQLILDTAESHWTGKRRVAVSCSCAANRLAVRCIVGPLILEALRDTEATPQGTSEVAD